MWKTLSHEAPEVLASAGQREQDRESVAEGEAALVSLGTAGWHWTTGVFLSVAFNRFSPAPLDFLCLFCFPSHQNIFVRCYGFSICCKGRGAKVIA